MDSQIKLKVDSSVKENLVKNIKTAKEQWISEHIKNIIKEDFYKKNEKTITIDYPKI